MLCRTGRTILQSITRQFKTCNSLEMGGGGERRKGKKDRKKEKKDTADGQCVLTSVEHFPVKGVLKKRQREKRKKKRKKVLWWVLYSTVFPISRRQAIKKPSKTDRGVSSRKQETASQNLGIYNNT